MKKVLAILALTLLPLFALGQNTDSGIETNETVIEKTLQTQKNIKETPLYSSVRSQLLKVNKKKNNEIISIKAYRKSLQIKVKTIKLC